ncbi:TPA: transporter substrate-binding domain-containing protein [Vibrio vulnificus]|uniref:Transporter substrate-binding domain-containing protein n=1 Tax=Vibrio vulnificus TaxID=672 RepID=A0A8H9MVF2_VIBVL|nr:transporter substrate-binding domain-containing protein [Vibrio vulnificus]HAS8538332.1 transporter substrate-binding domain-containing protein [Vibrio vulnificus]
MKLALTTVLSFAVSAPIFASTEVDETLTATQSVWSPYFIDNVSSPGVALEIVDAAFSCEGYSLAVTYMPWVRAFKTVSRNRADVVMGLWWSREREKTFAFSEPYLVNSLHLVSLGSTPLTNNDLFIDNLRVGSVTGYHYADSFMANPKLVHHQSYRPIELIEWLVKRRIDGALIDKLTFEFYVNRLGYDIEEFFVNPKPFVEYPLHLAVNKMNPDADKIIADFNKGIQLITETGLVDDIVLKYAQKTTD